MEYGMVDGWKDEMIKANGQRANPKKPAPAQGRGGLRAQCWVSGSGFFRKKFRIFLKTGSENLNPDLDFFYPVFLDLNPGLDFFSSLNMPHKGCCVL